MWEDLRSKLAGKMFSQCLARDKIKSIDIIVEFPDEYFLSICHRTCAKFFNSKNINIGSAAKISS